MTCAKVIEYTVCGKAARKLIFEEIKQNRRNRKLKHLIKEVRKLRSENETLRTHTSR